MSVRLILVSAVIGAASAPTLAREPASASAQVSALDAQAREPSAIVDAFHAALGKGDTAAALRLLSDDAIVFESGGAERGKAEYAAHHADADAAFASAVPSRVVRRTGRALGNTAWIATESRTTGRFKDRPVDSKTTETMVLQRDRGVWRIVHVYWSSATVRPKT